MVQQQQLLITYERRVAVLSTASADAVEAL